MNVEEARCGPIKKNSPNNKSYNQQQSNKKANGNGDTKINNWVHLVDSKLMFLCNKVCGFNTSHITGFCDIWAACVKNNQPFNLPATHVFQKKSGNGTVP